MSDSNPNSVAGLFWVNRNPMQKIANVGVGAGLVLGLVGASSTVVTLTPVAAGILYSRLTERKGAAKVGMSILAGALTLVTVTIGGLVGSGISKKEWLAYDSTYVSTPTNISPAAAPVSPVPSPAPAKPAQTAREINSDNCTSIAGMTLEQAQERLGESKLVYASGAAKYVPAFRMYKFGNAAFGGACSARVQNGRVESATFLQF